MVLISTVNPSDKDDELPTYNIAPMSSAFWLGDRCILGLASMSQTTQNLLRTKQCVLNLPAYSEKTIAAVNALAKTTGTRVLPESKASMGYSYVKDKFGVAGLTPVESAMVEPPRIKECAVQMEAEMVVYHNIFGDLDNGMQGFSLAIELKVLQTYVDDSIRMTQPGKENRIDHDRWRPMIMSFQHLYGVSPRYGSDDRDDPKIETVRAMSKLAEVDEELYRMPK